MPPNYPHARVPRSLSITPEIPTSALVDFIVCIVSVTIALFWVVLRICARVRQGKGLFFNDYAILWAMFWGMFLAINSIVTVTYGGVGHHMSTILRIAPQRIEPMLKTVLIGQFTWALSNTGVKVSIIDLYIKLFGLNRAFFITAYTLMGLVAAYCLMVILMAFLLCQPFQYNWDQTIPGGKCGDQQKAFLASGVLNLILDLAVLALPLPMLWKLRMSTHRKVGLSLMFSVGLAICGITIWRMIILHNLDVEDIFYPIGYLSTCTNLEPLLGIAIACIPICRSMVVRFGTRVGNKSTAVLSFINRGSTRMPSNLKNSTQQSSEAIVSKGSTSHDRTNFNRLYDHLYPLTDLGGLTQCEPDNSEEARERRNDQSSERIEITQTWDVEVEQRQPRR